MAHGDRRRVLGMGFLRLGAVVALVVGWCCLLLSPAAAYDAIEVYPTFQSAGIRVRPIPEEVRGARLFFRQAGEAEWRRGLDPALVVANGLLEERAEGPIYEDLDVVIVEKGPMIRRCHANLLMLEPGTTYEARVELLDAGGQVLDTVEPPPVTTWPDEHPFGESTGRTLRVPGDHSTIQAALNAASPGDMILVGPGTRYDMVTITAANSGAEGRPITIRGQDTVLADNPESPNVNPFFWFRDGAHDIVVEGFAMLGLKGYGGYNAKLRHVYISGDNVERIMIRDNVLSSPSDVTQSSYPIFVGQPGYRGLRKLVIERNRILAGKLTTGTLGTALFLEGGRQVVIRHNEIEIGESEDIISIRSGPHEEFDIHDNVIRGAAFDDGIELEGGVNINVRVWGNTVDNAGGQKAAVSHTPVLVGPVYVFRNVLYGSLQTYKVASNRLVYFDFTTGTLASFGPVHWYHNTIYHPYTDPIETDYPSFLRYANRLCHANIVLKNNIIWNRHLPAQAGQCTQLDPQDPTDGHRWGQLDVDYNLYYPQATNPNAAYGLDLNSLFGQNPMFESDSWGNLDLNLREGSPALDRGVLIYGINDNFGGDGPDLGAFEHGDHPAPERPPAGASLTLTMMVDNGEAAPGEVVTYTILYENASEAAAAQVTIASPIPEHTRYVEESATGGGVWDGARVRWELGEVAAGESGWVSYQVEVE